MPTSPESSPRPSDGRPTESDGWSWLSVARTAALLVVALAMVWLVFNVQLPELEDLRARIEEFGWGSWPAFVAVYAVVALTPIPVTVMALAGGVLFGVVIGSALSVVGSLLGALGAYWTARGLGKETVLRMLGSRRATLEKHLGSAGFEAVFTLRVLPGMPYWPVNYGAGALGVPFREFAVASGIASIPGQASLVAIGAFAANPTIFEGVFLVLAWAITISFTIWAWRSWKGTSSRPLPGSRGETAAPEES